jgi:hypothetical protein
LTLQLTCVQHESCCISIRRYDLDDLVGLPDEQARRYVISPCVLTELTVTG